MVPLRRALAALAAGSDPASITIDREHQRVVAAGAALPNATLATYRALERRVTAAAEGWTVEITPPPGVLPPIAFANNADTLDPVAREAVLTSAWAARRWNMRTLLVPGLPDGAPGASPGLAARRALAIAALLREQGITPAPAPAAAAPFALARPMIEETPGCTDPQSPRSTLRRS